MLSCEGVRVALCRFADLAGFARCHSQVWYSGTRIKVIKNKHQLYLRLHSRIGDNSSLMLYWALFSCLVSCAFLFPATAHAQALGNFRIATLLCKYADIADEPRDAAQIQRVYGDEVGGVNHFWKEASYGKSSLDGTSVAGWYTLPAPRSFYIDDLSGEPDVVRIVRDCAAQADPDIDFSVYHSINVLTNGPWSGGIGGVGGKLFFELDGKSEFAYAVMGYPGWQNQALLVHEIGHGFGLLHSNNSDADDDPYDNPWSVMSDVSHQAVLHPEFGLLAKHFIAYEKELLGWFDRNEILEIDLDSLRSGTSQSVFLTSLGEPNNPNGSFRLLKLTRGDSDDFFFTLEARERSGDYEAALPGSGVIIHEVDLRTRRAAWIIDGSDMPADRADTQSVVWQPGEVYQGDGFTIEVVARLSSGFQVSLTATNEVVAGNSVPFFRPVAANQNAAVGGLFQLYLHPLDADGFNPDLVSPNLPAGAVLTDNGNGVWIFEWTPLLQQIGTHDISFIARDAVDETLAARLDVSVEVTTLDAFGDAITLPDVSEAPGQPQPTFGNLPWVTLLCKFQDEAAEPATASFVQDMFGDDVGQINHWWKQVSYDRVNIDGSLVLGWYTLPGSRRDYVRGDDTDDDVDDERLTRECMHAADADVDFSRFFGVNTFFNSGFNPHAVGFGEPRFIALDNAGAMATTAISSPAWASHTSVLHEMALALGLPRSNNSDRDATTFDNPWTNMSDGQGYAVSDLRYGFLAKHLNAFEKYSLGWLPSAEVTELNLDTPVPGGLQVRLAPMSAQTIRSSSRRAIILRDTRFGRQVFYTIEARDNSGIGHYDEALPGTAILVHQIDMLRDEPAWILYDTTANSQPSTYSATENDMWKVGETIRLPGASIAVTGRTRDGFNLFIQTGLDDDLLNTTADSGLLSSETEDRPSVAFVQSEPVRGWLPWVNLLCEFADSEESELGPEYVDRMFSDRSGGLGDYWDIVSSGKMSVSGSEAHGWYRLSGNRADYISDNEISRSMLDECIQLADPDVDFSEYYGVNLLFNGEFNALASGFAGKRLIGADGVGLKAYTAISDPSWQWQATVAHEMARGMGLTLTDNSDEDDNPFDNPWTLMSDSRAYAELDPLFAFRPKFMNAHDMERLGWLDESDIFELDRVLLNNDVSIAVDIDLLSLEDAEQPRLLKIAGADAGLYYYVEARTRSGLYDGSLPGSGVLIHEVRHVPTRRIRLYHDLRNGPASDYADSVDDIWTRGESTELGGVTLEVAGESSSGFRLVLSANDSENVEVFPLPDSTSAQTDELSDADGIPVESGFVSETGADSGSVNGESSTLGQSNSIVNADATSVQSSATGGGGGGALWLTLFLLLPGFFLRRQTHTGRLYP